MLLVGPQVDKSEEPFSWASPDIDGLRALCQRVLGWDRAQSDGLFMPMVKVRLFIVFFLRRGDACVSGWVGDLAHHWQPAMERAAAYHAYQSSVSSSSTAAAAF